MKLLKFSIIILAIFLVMSLFGTLLGGILTFLIIPSHSTFLEACLETFLSLSIPLFFFILALGGLFYIKYFSEDNEKH